MTLRVLIADDQHLIRSGLKMILQASGVNVVGEAEDGASAVKLASHCALTCVSSTSACR